MREDVPKTSMLYWWPVVKDLGIPVPATEIVEVPQEQLMGLVEGKNLSEDQLSLFMQVALHIGFPLFVRTDMGSAKHSWEETCFVDSPTLLFQHIWTLIDRTLASGMMGELDPSAIVFRKYIPMATEFTAFRGLPIGSERRYFVRDGVIECHHAYWIEEAIAQGWPPPSRAGWEEVLGRLNFEEKHELETLYPCALLVGKALPGFWSVDFCLGADNVWYLIDMAEGEKSWHPEHAGGKE